MANGSTTNLKFYCPVHQIRFDAAGQTVVSCEQGGHLVGSGYPRASWWEFCCDCGTFWPADPTDGDLQRTECRVCERSTAKRYLCASCQVVSIESIALVRRKTYSIDAESGIKPNCPGCDTVSNGQLQEHDCKEANVQLLTSRSSCPFCEDRLGGQVSVQVEQPAPAASKHCPFCGTQHKPSNRFCKKCGNALPQATELAQALEAAARREAEEAAAQKTAEARQQATGEALRFAEEERRQEAKRQSEARAAQTARETKAKQTSTIAAALEAGKRAYQEEKQRVEEAGRQNEERQRLALELQRRAEEEAAQRVAEEEGRRVAGAEADRQRKEEVAREEAHRERLRVQEARRQQEEHQLLAAQLHLRAREEEAIRKAESASAPAEPQLVAVSAADVEPPNIRTSLPAAAADSELEPLSNVPEDSPVTETDLIDESSQLSFVVSRVADISTREAEPSSHEDSTGDVGATDTKEFAQASEYVPSWHQPSAADTTPSRRVPWMLVSGLLVVAVIVITVATIAMTRRAEVGDPHNDNQPPPTPSMTSIPSRMVLIAGGEFLMGTDANDADLFEKPAHKSTVASFYIGTTEVTCDEYLKFVSATSHRTPANWVNRQCPDSAGMQPVTGVDWDDAVAYAKWAGKRLPTEEEWEFAARGTTGWRYPWGNEWKADAANAGGDSKSGRFADVGSHPAGKSPFGTMDMIGNAWEWTSTEWKGYPNGSIPPDASNQLRVIRGGYWGSSPPKATTTFRRGWPARNAEDGYKNTGFRCAADVPAQAKQEVTK